MTITKYFGVVPTVVGLCLAGTLFLGACTHESFNILNTYRPTVEDLTGNPNRATLARAAVGSAASIELDLGGEIVYYAFLGREGWNLLGNDPRIIYELLHGPLNERSYGGAALAGK